MTKPIETLVRENENSIKRNVLLIEDDEAYIYYATKPLKRAGYGVEVARTLEDVNSVLEREDHFDVFLVELAMFKRKGRFKRKGGTFNWFKVEEARRLYKMIRGSSDWLVKSRSFPKYRWNDKTMLLTKRKQRIIETPCILLVSSVPESIGREVWARCYAYLEKPYLGKDLVGAVREILANRYSRKT